MFYEIKANGRYYDTVYYASNKKNADVKKEFQTLLKTDNVRVRKSRSLI